MPRVTYFQMSPQKTPRKMPNCNWMFPKIVGFPPKSSILIGEVFILFFFFFFLGGFFSFFGPLVPAPLIPWCPGHLVTTISSPYCLVPGALVSWSSGPLVRWFPGPLVFWSPGPLVPCSFFVSFFLTCLCFVSLSVLYIHFVFCLCFFC